MEDFNLMEFVSPQPKTTSPIAANGTSSPGDNPFDSLSKQLHLQSDIYFSNESRTPPTHFQAYPQHALEHFFKMNNNVWSNDGEAKTFLDMSGRESLGILKLDALNTSLSSEHFGVPNVLLSNFEDFQKSSQSCNSPLNTAFLHPLSYCNRKQSTASSSSLSPNPSLFNSGSLEASEPSKIYSLNGTTNFDLGRKSTDVFNDAFLNTVSQVQLSVTSPNSLCCKVDVQKLARSNNEEIETRNVRGSTKDYLESEQCWNECEANRAVITPVKKARAESNDVDDETDNVFHDSVFIEANHLASKIADGSILMNQSFDDNLLDCTSPPSFADTEENEAQDVKIDTETVFQAIDRMLPLQTNDLPQQQVEYIENIETDISLPKQNNSTYDKMKEFKQGLRNIFNENHSQKFSTSCNSSGSTKSRDPNELLHDLSEIINNDYRDCKQKIEGQHLLFSLADILCSDSSKISSNDKIDSLEDSGHSSIEQEDQQNERQDLHVCYEVLDLRKLTSKSNDNEQILDLSTKSKAENVDKRLSQSCSIGNPKLPPTKLFDSLKAQNSLKSSASSLELSNNTSNADLGKLKPKKLERQTVAPKKGPLKAIIPLGNMSKRKSLSKLQQSAYVTPPKLEQGQSALFKVKRTSTPLAEPQLKPIAQSTPDSSQPPIERNKPTSCSSQLKKRKFYCPVSPLARPNSIGDNTSVNSDSKSGSVPNLLNTSANFKSSIPSVKPMSRRHSATELKIAANVVDKPVQLKRSYSIGRDFKSPSITNKLKANICATLSSLKTANVNLSKKSVLQSSNQRSGDRVSDAASSNSKRFSLVGRLKMNKLGKENAKA